MRDEVEVDNGRKNFFKFFSVEWLDSAVVSATEERGTREKKVERRK